jgi:hypothetical protein
LVSSDSEMKIRCYRTMCRVQQMLTPSPQHESKIRKTQLGTPLKENVSLSHVMLRFVPSLVTAMLMLAIHIAEKSAINT